MRTASCGCGKDGSAFSRPAAADSFSLQKGSGDTGAGEAAESSNCLLPLCNLPAMQKKSCMATKGNTIAKRISTAAVRQSLTNSLDSEQHERSLLIYFGFGISRDG